MFTTAKKIVEIQESEIQISVSSRKDLMEFNLVIV